MTDRWHAGGSVVDAGGLVAPLAGDAGDIEFGGAPADGETVGVAVADATEPHEPLVYVDEWPRASTGEELTAARNIAASTFQYHLRAAERKLVSAVLDPAEL